MITKDNCEAYFLDYHEGNLSAEATAELMLFLEQHPELQEEFDSFELLELEACETTLGNKGGMKKQVALDEEDYISYIERVADNKTVLKVEEAVKLSSTVKKEMELFQRTILVPEQIEYSNKRQLKRKEGKVIPLYYAVAAAAAILVLLIASFLFNNKVDEMSTIAESGEPENKERSITSIEKIEAKNTIATGASTSKQAIQANKVLSPVLAQSNAITKHPRKEYQQMESNNIRSVPTNYSGGRNIVPIIKEADATFLLPDIAAESTYTQNELERLTLKEQLIAQKTDIKTGKPKKEERLLLFANVAKKLFKKAPVKTHAEYDQHNNIIAYSVDFRNIHFEKK